MTDTVISVEHLSKLDRIGRAPKVRSHRRDAAIAEKNMANLRVLRASAVN